MMTRAAASTTPAVKKRLTLDTLSPGVKIMQYAVRGPVVQAADALNEKLRLQSSSKKKSTSNGVASSPTSTMSTAVAPAYPFDHIVYTNVGNPQSVGQAPLTWPRQVVALVDLPNFVGIDHPAASTLFPADAIARAREIKHAIQPTAPDGGSSGAYSHSQGVMSFREDVAKFIQARDGGVPCNPHDLFLTNGASAAITLVLTCLIASPKTGVLIPIPQYPIYSANIALLGGQQVGYHLDESRGWELNLQELDRAYNDALKSGVDVAAMVIINPGNPTGQVLSPDNVKDIVRFCSERNLVLLSDEVYQENVYAEGSVFCSAKKAAADTGLLDANAIELISFHSISKGVFGECGRRGGYMELVGLDPDVQAQMYKLASSGLCSSVSGQIMISLMVRGPAPTDVSYASHQKEIQTIFDSLKRRSQLVTAGLNQIPGFSCNLAQGSMYCFPRVDLPQAAIAEAQRQGMAPDTLYALSLLESTGICVVPASGFKQVSPGRYGFRTTFLPPETEMTDAVQRMGEHYKSFCEQYA